MTDLDVDRDAVGFFDGTWRRIIDTRPAAVREHLDAERLAFAALLDAGPAYRSVIEAGCADGSLLLPVVRARGLDYLGLDVAAGAVEATRAALAPLTAAGELATALRGDIRDLPKVIADEGLLVTPPVLAALPFNVFGNIPQPVHALAAAAAIGADALVLTYDTGPRAKRVRAEYYQLCGFDGTFTTDETGVHFTAGLFTSSVYRRAVVRGWLAGLGYRVSVTRYGPIGLAYHGRLRPKAAPAAT